MNVVPLGKIAKFIRGVTFKPEDVLDKATSESVGIMRTKNVQEALDVTDVLQISRDLVRRDDQYLREGDILVSSANSWNLVGKCSWVPNLAMPAAIGGFVTALRAISSDIDKRYLYHWFSSPYTQAEVRNTANQTTNIANLSIARCERLELPLPSLDEQRRIAAILDRAHGLRAMRKVVLQHHRDLPGAVFRETFGRWSGPSATIAEVALQEKGSIRTGPFGSQLLHSEFVDQGIAVLGLDNVIANEFTWAERRYITAEKYDALRRYTVRPGDVLMSIMGTCGRCVVVPDDIETAINTKHVCAITVDTDKALPEFVRAAFLWHPISRRFLARMTKGSIMDGLNMGIIKATPIPLPDLDAQYAFVESAKAIDECTRVAADLHAKSDELFASIQARSFRGEL